MGTHHTIDAPIVHRNRYHCSCDQRANAERAAVPPGSGCVLIRRKEDETLRTRSEVSGQKLRM